MKYENVEKITWNANELLGHETETDTLDFLSEMRPRPPLSFPRPRHYKFSKIGLVVTKIGLETEMSRPRLHPCCSVLNI